MSGHTKTGQVMSGYIRVFHGKSYVKLGQVFSGYLILYQVKKI